jgi:predicted ATP-binding protein involved in virulence
MSKTRKSSKKNSSVKNKKLSTESIPGKCCDATMYGINHWYHEMFEKLGWMILAKSRGMTDKIQTYLNSLHRLHTAIEQKIEKVHDIDHKNDLKIMLENVTILLQHSEMDLSK